MTRAEKIDVCRHDSDWCVFAGGASAIQGDAYANELQFVVGALTDGVALDAQTIAPPSLVSGYPGCKT